MKCKPHLKKLANWTQTLPWQLRVYPLQGQLGLNVIMCSQGYAQKPEAVPGLPHLCQETEKSLPTAALQGLHEAVVLGRHSL